MNTPNFLIQARIQYPGAGTDEELKKLLMLQMPTLVDNWVGRFEAWKEGVKAAAQHSIDESTLVVCFSDAIVKPTDEILIWSHYAKKHEGIRVGFEFPDDKTNPFTVVEVDYRKRRMEVDVSFGVENKSVENAYYESIKVKSLVWSYENEYRLLTKPANCESRMVKKCHSPSTLEHFLDFKRE